MYITSLLLKNEINNIENADNSGMFLENTPCGFFLEQLCDKSDIKSFYKINILKAIENLEWTFSSKRISFDIEYIQKNIKIIKEEIAKKYKNNKRKNNEITENMYLRKSNTLNALSFADDDTISVRSYISKLSTVSNLPYEKEFLKENRNESDLREFNQKYIDDVSIQMLEKKLNLVEKEKNNNFKEYLKYHIEEIKKNENNNENSKSGIYGNDGFINNVYICENSEEVLAIYITSFLKVIEIINLLFENLFSNTHLVPYSIKCICKIILILIKKKFPDINKVQQNAFLSKFFFDKLLFPILENPSYNALINEYIISEETINNLNTISKIISQLSSGKLYTKTNKNGYYTPFNNFFLEKIPDVYNFLDDLSEVNLPEFIENLINDKLPKEFKPNYFKDHPEEIIFNRSIFFCVDDFYSLVTNMKKCKEKIFINENENNNIKTLQIIFNKIIKDNNMKILEEIKNNKSYEEIPVNNTKNKNKNKKKEEDKGAELKKYFIINKLLINEKYSYIFKLNEEKLYFTIAESEKAETQEQIDKNNIIKVKNLISPILYNYQLLKNIHLKKENTLNSVNIFKELKKLIKISDNVMNETIPIEWHLNTLLEYLNKIPKNLSDNDFELLYKELENDINNSIKFLNLDILSSFLEKIKFAQKKKTFYQQAYEKVADIYLNDKAQLIIEYSKIPCELFFMYNEKEKRISIKEIKKQDNSINFLDTMILKEPPKGTKICKTIKSFTNNFPNIVKNALFYGENAKIMEMLKQLEIPKTVLKYLKIVKSNLHNMKLWSGEEEFINVNNKIYDFVTEKVYDKIYPLVPSSRDVDIYNNCVKLSWTEPKHYIKAKRNYIFDSFLPDIIHDFNQIDIQKSTRKKIYYMKDIFNFINKVEQFNGEDGNNIGIEEQVSILNYAFIKAQPNNIDTNCNYIELFIDKDGEEDSLLTQLRVICNFAYDIKYDSLIGVTKEEFDSKMNENNEEEKEFD